MNSIPSLLSRDESNALKGLLILLIVLGHNSLIMRATGLFPWLYSFHVYAFYIFPFIYGLKELTKNEKGKWLGQRIWKNVCRFYPLYIGWSLLGAAAGVLSGKIAFQPFGIIYAIFMGNETLLAHSCGFALFWFLPTIVAVMFWRDLYFVSTVSIKITVLLISVILWISSAVGLTNFHSAGLWLPFAVIQGLFFTASGIISRNILLKINSGIYSKICCVILLFAALSYVYFRKYLPASYAWLTWFIVPPVFFITIYQFRSFLGKITPFRFLGEYSLQIYLLHSFIFNILYRYTPWKNIAAGIVMYLITLVCSILVALICKKTPFKKILFT